MTSCIAVEDSVFRVIHVRKQLDEAAGECYDIGGHQGILRVEMPFFVVVTGLPEDPVGWVAE